MKTKTSWWGVSNVTWAFGMSATQPRPSAVSRNAASQAGGRQVWRLRKVFCYNIYFTTFNRKLTLNSTQSLCVRRRSGHQDAGLCEGRGVRCGDHGAALRQQNHICHYQTLLRHSFLQLSTQTHTFLSCMGSFGHRAPHWSLGVKLINI